MVMKYFRYVGNDNNGKSVKGTMEATSRAACVRLLEQKNIHIIKIDEYSNIFTKMNNISFGATIKQKVLIFFLKQLGSLLNAGIKLVEALEILANQETNKKVRKVYMALQQEVYNGNKFSEALEMFKNDFPPLLISMVEVGEVTGDLGNIIVKTAEHFDKSTKNTKKIMSVVKSPMMYIIILLVVIVGMSMFVFPNFSNIYSSMGAGELPFITLVFTHLSDFLVDNAAPLFIGIAVAIIAFIVCKKYVLPFKHWLDKMSLKIPMLGSLLQMNAQMMIASTLAQLMSRSVNSVEALRITRRVATNFIYQQILDDTIQNVQDGKEFSKAFEESWAVDPIMARMIATGEKTSEIPKLMTNLAEFYDSTADAKVDRIKAIVQPIMMLVVYVAVACLMLAIMLPQLNLGSQMM